MDLVTMSITVEHTVEDIRKMLWKHWWPLRIFILLRVNLRLGGKTLGCQSFTAESKKIKTVRKIENFRRYPPLVRLKQLLTNSNNANSHDTVNMILLVTRVIPD